MDSSEIQVNFVIRSEHEKNMVQVEISLRVKPYAKWGDIWNDIYRQEEAETAENAVFRVKDDGEHVLVDKGDPVFDESERKELSLVMKLVEKLNSELDVEVIVDLPLDADWARREHPNVDQRNRLLFKEVIIKLRQYDRVDRLFEAMEPYESRYLWDPHARGFGEMKLVVGCLDQFAEVEKTKTLKEGEIVTRYGEDSVVEAAVVYLTHRDGDFGQLATKPEETASASFRPPLKLELHGYSLKMPFEPSEEEFLLVLTISDRIKYDSGFCTIVLPKTLRTKDVTWGGYVLLRAREFFNVYEDCASLNHGGEPLDLRAKVWDSIPGKEAQGGSHAKVHLTLEKEDLYDLSIRVGSCVRKVEIFENDPLGAVFAAMGLDAGAYRLVVMRKKESSPCDLGKSLAQNGLEGDKKMTEFVVEPRGKLPGKGTRV